MAISAATYALLAALAAKGYGTWRQNKHSQRINDQRNAAIRASRQRARMLAEDAFKANRKSLEPMDVENVADARTAEESRLGELLSATPRKEFAVANPTRIGEPNVITSARATTKDKALGDILRYAGDLGNLSAATGIASTPEQQHAAIMGRADVRESALQGREEAERLRLLLAGLDPYSQEAHMADKVGDLLAMYAMGVA